MRPVRLDGVSLTQRTLVEVAHGAPVELDATALKAVARAAEFLAEQAVVRIAAADFRAQEFLDPAIGHGDRTGVRLGLDRRPMAEPSQGDRTGLADQVLGEIEDLVGPCRYGLWNRHRALPWRLTDETGRPAARIRRNA